MAKLTVTAELLDSVIDEILDNNALSVHTDYSGRGMYGETCFGVDSDEKSVLSEFEATLAARITQANSDEIGGLIDADDFLIIFSNLTELRRTDGMGMGVIWYYPKLEVTGTLQERYDEDDYNW